MDATPLNIIALLVVALAIVALIVLLQKHYESNFPLLFYFVAVVFTSMSERTVNPILLYGGLGLTLLVRFEFLNNSFSKVMGYLATTALCGIILVFLAEVFGDGTAPF